MSTAVIPSTIEECIAWAQSHPQVFVDLRFTDSCGTEHHMTLMSSQVNDALFAEGKLFDGSSIAGWKSINHSDMLLMPDISTAYFDPFTEQTTLNITCEVVEPSTMMGYERDPRSVAKRAEAYLKSTGIADHANLGTEPEFFIFDDVRTEISTGQVSYSVDSEEAAWNSNTAYSGGNMGHRPAKQGGYVPVPPVDSSQDIRSAMCLMLQQVGVEPEVHHHEVATANQNEIGFKYTTLLKKADETQRVKYVVRNVAHQYGKTATFLPKPLAGDNGNGMHCHQSLVLAGKNIFSGDLYAGLSETALYYIGGIIKHAKALNAFTNPSTNSYRRLVPGFEAPVMLAYSARNRSAAIRVPVSPAPGRRIEVRFPDPSANPYLAFSAMLMAGIDGIKNKIHPGDPMDKDLYDLPPEELTDIPTVANHLSEALDSLLLDADFLLQGDVFSKDLLEGYVALKRKEIDRLRSTPHPLEFDMYYSC